MRSARGQRVRRTGLVLLAPLLALAWLVQAGGQGVAAIPPTGPLETTATLTVSPTGSVSATEKTSFDSYRDSELPLGAEGPVGFRLPDRHRGPFPVYLRPQYHDASAKLDGSRVQLEVKRVGHSYAAQHASQLEEGRHRFVLRYRQDGGARVTGDQVEIRWRHLSGGLERVVVHGPALRGARCVDAFWRERSCGHVDDGTLVVDDEALQGEGEDRAQSLVIVADAKPYDVPAPQLDRD